MENLNEMITEKSIKKLFTAFQFQKVRNKC